MTIRWFSWTGSNGSSRSNVRPGLAHPSGIPEGLPHRAATSGVVSARFAVTYLQVIRSGSYASGHVERQAGSCANTG
jgi:hypothetical protein